VADDSVPFSVQENAMQRYLRTVAVLSIAVLISGCSIAGTWNTVKTEPAGSEARSPFQMVTFNEDGGYTATGQHGSEVVTNTGKYEWDGFKLTIHPSEGEDRVYPGTYNMFTKQLILTHKTEDTTMKAWMERVAEGEGG
jgi:hypothetical protein